jgi:hypothetical protein
LWGDELLTLYTSSLHDWRTITELLESGGEFHPPFFYALESACLSLFGATELALRIPAIAGVWLMVASLFAYLRRRVGAGPGFAGACFPLLTSAAYFATEARGYALVLGFGSFALLCWDRCGEGRPRGLPVLGFALSLVAAAASSYYAILLVVPFAIGQAVRSYRMRTVQPAVWCALAAVIVPAILSGGLIRTGARAVHNWPAPPWTVAIGFYADMLQQALIPMGFFLALVAGTRFLRPKEEPQTIPFVPPLEHLALAFAFLGFSVWVIAAAKLATHAFALRYAIPSVIGASILVGFVAARGGRLEQRALVAIVACYAIAGAGWRSITHYRQERIEWDANVAWLGARTRGSVVAVDAVGTFLRLSHYAPADLRSRMMMPADPARARHYGVDDSGDHTLLVLNPWFRLPVTDYDSFTHSHEEFFLLSDHWKDWAEWQWLTRALVDDGRRVTLEGQHVQWLLYRVTQKLPD